MAIADGLWTERPSPKGDFSARVLDVLLSASALVFLLPLLVAIALAQQLVDPGPVIFGQLRIGRDGRHFHCFKFRTMVVDAETRLQSLLSSDAAARREWATNHKLTTDPRITALGRFLRTSSLDELPQLMNVLRGEMSLIGPRPIVPGEVHRYGRYFAHYCSIRPGLTGLWQVLGRGRVSYRRRVAMDVLYVRRRSLALNLRILVLTLPAVLTRKGAS